MFLEIFLRGLLRTGSCKHASIAFVVSAMFASFSVLFEWNNNYRLSQPLSSSPISHAPAPVLLLHLRACNRLARGNSGFRRKRAPQIRPHQLAITKTSGNLGPNQQPQLLWCAILFLRIFACPVPPNGSKCICVADSDLGFHSFR